MFLEILGSPQLNIANKQHCLAAKRPFLLLSYLAYRQEAVVRDEVLALFWPEKSERDARHSLRQLVYKAKKELYGEAFLVTDDKLSVDILSDVAEFQAALEIEDWAKALELYKGDFLQGVHKDNSYAVEQWLTLTRHDLKNSWHYAVLKRSAELNAIKDYDTSILNLQTALEKDELSEEFLQALLRAQIQAGKFQEAHQCYEKFCFRLEHELDLEPSKETQKLFTDLKLLESESIRVTPKLDLEVANADESSDGIIVKEYLLGKQEEHTLDLSEYLKETPDLLLQQPTEGLNNLYSKPSALTPFIGRLEDLAKLANFISGPERILTITGFGGIGKTRLAEQFLIEQAHNFRHGSIDVALTSVWISDASPAARAQAIEAIATAMAYALDLKLSGIETVKQQVLTAIKDKEMLIFLDNFEQLQQVSSFVLELANATPQSKIVVTSRVLLGLSGEMVYDLQGLAVPSMTKDSKNSNFIDTLALEQYDAIVLFLASARRMNKPIVLDTTTESFLINICQLLEGIPLAIELAATWLRLFSLETLHKELCKGFSLLSSIESTSSEVDNQNQRHHSLRTVFDYSWSLLSSSQQTVLAKLAVFQSPFSLEAAQYVTESSLIDLLTLVNSSLVQQAESDYLSIHKFTQEYLQLKFKEMFESKEETEEVYKQYYVTLLAQQKDGFHNRKEKITLDLIEKATNNVNVVWEKIVQTKDYSAIDKVIYTLAYYYDRKILFNEASNKFSTAYTELWELIQAELIRVESPDSIDRLTENSKSSESHVWVNEQNSSLARVLAKLLIYRAHFQQRLKNQHEAVHLSKEGLDLEKHVRSYLKQAECLSECLTTEVALGNNTLATVNMFQGNHEEAQKYYYNTLDIYQKLEQNWGIANTFSNLGLLNLRLGKFDKSEDYLLQSLELRRKSGDTRATAISLSLLANSAFVQNNFLAAEAYYKQAYALRKQVNDIPGQALVSNGLGNIAYSQSNYDVAETHFLHSMDLYQANDIQPACNVLTNLGLIKAKKQDLDSAVSFFLQAFLVRMTSSDQMYLLLYIGLASLEAWQQENKAALLFKQVLNSPSANVYTRKTAQDMFEKLPESCRNAARENKHSLQEIQEQMIEDLSAMQQKTFISK